MPIIIENLEVVLLTEVRKQIEEKGYGAITIRSIAKGCGVGVGTVYNYFPSKEALIATHLLQDWKNCMNTMQTAAAQSESPGPIAQCICEQLNAFASRHASVFRDEGAAAVFSGSFSQYHSLLRNQLAQPLRRFSKNDFTAQFIAESLLVWTMERKSFDEIYEIIEKLF